MPSGPDYFAEQDGILAETTDTAPASPEDRISDARATDVEQDVRLKRIVARIALSAVVVQILFADVVFWRYAEAQQWRLDTPAISAWLGATVTEVIGLAFVITSYLFPKRGRN